MLAVWLGLAAWVLCGAAAVVVVSKASAQQALARGYLEQVKRQAGVPAVSAAVSVRGRLVFSEGVGAAELVSGTRQSGRTVHNIGSVSKVETAVAVMQLVERGKVQLDAEIQRYAPWFPRRAKPITLRQLLTHTSGIRHYHDGELAATNCHILRHYDNFEESTRFWRNDALLFTPGTHFSYSSYAVNLLQAVIELSSGQAFEAYMREHVWTPAGMVDSQFDVPSRIVERRGRAYVHDAGTGQLKNPVEEDLSYKYASGGMLASDEDLCRFGHALNAGLLLSAASLAELYRLQLSKSVTSLEVGEPPQSETQALGFRLSRDARGHTYAGHAGFVKGSVSQFLNFFRDDVSVAVYMSADSEAVALTDVAETLAAMFDSSSSEREAALVDSLFGMLPRTATLVPALGHYAR